MNGIRWTLGMTFEVVLIVVIVAAFVLLASIQ